MFAKSSKKYFCCEILQISLQFGCTDYTDTTRQIGRNTKKPIPIDCDYVSQQHVYNCCPVPVCPFIITSTTIKLFMDFQNRILFIYIGQLFCSFRVY